MDVVEFLPHRIPSRLVFGLRSGQSTQHFAVLVYERLSGLSKGVDR